MAIDVMVPEGRRWYFAHEIRRPKSKRKQVNELEGSDPGICAGHIAFVELVTMTAN